MKSSRTYVFKAGCLAILLTINPLANGLGQPVPTNAPPGLARPDSPAYAPGEVLVKFSNNVTDEQIARAFRGASLRFVKQVQTPVMQQSGDIGITRALTAVPVEQAVAVLKQLPGIEYAEPNWVYTHQVIPNDPYFGDGSMWGMYGNLGSPANPYGSQAAEAWAAGYFGSGSVVVGVIDEGIQITHPDLAANIWVNPGEIAGNGVDDDSNGYIDDVNGWDFFENNNSVYDGAGDDHGTHVAGTIGAVGNNSQGVVGINWSVKIISAKFLGPNGGYTADAIQAVDYFTALRLNGVPIVALNNSWGGGSYSQGLHDAIIRAAKAGILFIAAAGNGNKAGKAINNDATPYYPASFNTAVSTPTEEAAGYDSVVAVTAIDRNGNKASFANYGATKVDLGAPGVEILSTLPNGYGIASGTSMATPHVTGAMALYASTHPNANALEIKYAILDFTAPTLSLAGKTVTGGRLDLSTVITPPTTPTSPPTAPSGFSASAISHSQIKLEWTDTSNNESSFVITRMEDAVSTVITVGANVTSYTDSGLKPSTTYNYTIAAVNSKGSSDSIAASTTTKAAPPTATVSNFQFDDVTKGNWIGKYGAEGYSLITYTKPLSTSAGTFGFAGEAIYHPWASRTGDSRALLTPNGRSRFAACYYTSDTTGKFYIDVNITDGKPRRVAIYCLDWDRQQRIETIEIVDRNNGTVLGGAELVSGFSEGRYLMWDITGPVLIKIKWVDNPNDTGDNAVVSGVFVDPI